MVRRIAVHPPSRVYSPLTHHHPAFTPHPAPRTPHPAPRAPPRAPRARLVFDWLFFALIAVYFENVTPSPDTHNPSPDP